MPYIFSRERSANADQNQALLDSIALDVYYDMGLITKSEYENAHGNTTAQIDLLMSIPDLSGDNAYDFSTRFVARVLDQDSDLLYSVPPSALAKAYVKIKESLASDGLGDQERQTLENQQKRISDRIDSLINDFSAQVGYHFVDTTNIADVYAGYNEMFDAREPDITDANLRSQISSNRTVLETYISEYDRLNRISSIDDTTAESAAEHAEENYDKAWTRMSDISPDQSTMDIASKYKFLDENGQEIPQFDSETNKLISDSKLANVINLARHDITMQNVFDESINDKSNESLQSELNKAVLYKLFEIDTAEKIAQGIAEDPERFTNPENFNKFITELSANGGSISHDAYNDAMDAQVNKTAGFAQRVKQKLGKFASKATGFFKKVFKPIENIDKRARDRVVPDKRMKRVDFFKRILMGFGSAFLVSAAITTIATAAAAVSGLSIAAAMATVGVVSAIAVSYFQIKKWRDTQRLNGKDDSVSALLKDKRMLASLGTTAIAAIAMSFGAAGFTQAASVLGFGALALGGGSNVVATYKDAKNSGMSTAESISWALANAAAVIGGAIAGRVTAGAVIDSYNNHNPENTIFQSEQTTVRQETHVETHTVYTQDAMDNAERIAKTWFADNPGELQRRVDMVNAYNSEHGTNINPYRAVMLSADAGAQTFDNMALHVDGGGVEYSGGRHTVLTQQWAHDNDISMSDIDALRHMFDGNRISSHAMNAAMDIDQIVSATNEVGPVSSGSAPHYDGVLPQNTFDANGEPVFDTYTDGNSAFTTNTTTYTYSIEDTMLTPENNGAVGMFGVKADTVTQNLRDSAGSLADKIRKQKPAPTPDPDPVPNPDPDPVPTPDPDPVPNPDPDPVPEPDPEQKKLPGGPRIAGLLPEHIPEDKPQEIKQIEGSKETLLLPEHVPDAEEVKDKDAAKYLRMSVAQANDLWKLVRHIEDLTSEKQSKPLTKKQSETLDVKLKTAKQKMQTLLNKLGRPDKDAMYNGMYWAWRKDDLKSAKENLEKLLSRQAHFNDSTTKHDRAAVERAIAALQKKIAEYEAEIPDESMFFDPVHLQRDSETAEYISHEELQQKKKSRRINKDKAVDAEVQDIVESEDVSESEPEQNTMASAAVESNDDASANKKQTKSSAFNKATGRVRQKQVEKGTKENPLKGKPLKRYVKNLMGGRQ